MGEDGAHFWNWWNLEMWLKRVHHWSMLKYAVNFDLQAVEKKIPKVIFFSMHICML